MTDTLTRLYDMLREAKVMNAHWSPSMRLDNERKHPLAALWAHQDSAGHEDGLTVPCTGDTNHVGWRPCRVIGYREGHQPSDPETCNCQGSGRVLRDTSDWPESAVKGWVRWMCQFSYRTMSSTPAVGLLWIVANNPTESTPVMLDALEAAVCQELGVSV